MRGKEAWRGVGEKLYSKVYLFLLPFHHVENSPHNHHPERTVNERERERGRDQHVKKGRRKKGIVVNET